MLLSGYAERAGLGNVTWLAEQRAVAAIRSMQTPTSNPDRHGGLSWADAFRSVTATDTALVTDGVWHTRIACVPARAVGVQRLGPRWLAPILVDLHPSVVRTVSMGLRPIAAEVARVNAVDNATTDTAAAVADAGLITDGTHEVLLTASTRVLRDLQPGSGHAGLGWVMFIAVQCPDADTLADACRRIEVAAKDCAITELDWLTHQQDLAWPAVLPLGRGMDMS